MGGKTIEPLTVVANSGAFIKGVLSTEGNGENEGNDGRFKGGGIEYEFLVM